MGTTMDKKKDKITAKKHPSATTISGMDHIEKLDKSLKKYNEIDINLRKIV